MAGERLVTAPVHIGVSLGQITHFQDGLGEFSRQLCQGLAALAPRLHERHGIVFWFHMHEYLHGSFGDAVQYLSISKWQRLRHRQAHPFAIWHNLNQLNKTLPPSGTTHRVVTVHDLNFFYFKAGYSFYRDLHRTRRMLARTDRVVAITDYVRKDVQQRLAWHGPADVIHNGARSLVDHEQAPCPPLLGKDYLFHLSRMSPSKNIQAILDLAASWPEQHFVLAGPQGRDTRKVQARLEAHPLGNVSLMLNISDAQKAWLYAHCGGFVFPSITEGFGLPPIEAMHFGKSVFLSRLTSLPEVGGPVAHYFDKFDPASMRATVEAGRAADASPGRSQAIAAHAAQFSWERCAAAYAALYVKLVAA